MRSGTFRVAYKRAGNAVQRRRVPSSTVVVTLQRSNVVIADRLARGGLRVGLLNPSDPLALQAGYLGMYFARWETVRVTPRLRPRPHRPGGVDRASDDASLASQGSQPGSLQTRALRYVPKPVIIFCR